MHLCLSLVSADGVDRPQQASSTAEALHYCDTSGGLSTTTTADNDRRNGERINKKMRKGLYRWRDKLFGATFAGRARCTPDRCLSKAQAEKQLYSSRSFSSLAAGRDSGRPLETQFRLVRQPGPRRSGESSSLADVSAFVRLRSQFQRPPYARAS